MFVRTPRLFLRPGWSEDAPALAVALADIGVARMLSQVPNPYTLDDAAEFLARPVSVECPSMLVFARTRGQPRLVGGVGLHRNGGGAVELGYWIDRPYWGLGYATEACRAVVDIAFQGLRLEALNAAHYLDNPAAARVLDKLGFRPTGRVADLPSQARGRAAPCREMRLVANDRRPASPGNSARARTSLAA